MNDINKDDKHVSDTIKPGVAERVEKENNCGRKQEDYISEVDDKLIGDDLAIAQAGKGETDAPEAIENSKNNY